MKKLVIDTDPGIDDALALISALKCPGLDVVAVTAVTGNLTSERTEENVRKILELMRATHLPVAQGPLTPLDRPLPHDPFSHGDNGLANIDLPEPVMPLDHRSAAELIVDTVNTVSGPISIAGLGPLTNIALALDIDPDLPSKVAELTILGGAFGFTPFAWSQATGDNPVSEWNIYVDPEAADRVFRAGFRLTAVGLDVATHPNINLNEERLARINGCDLPEAHFAAETFKFVRSRRYQSYCALIDTLVIAALAHPELVSTREITCTVETQGYATRGMTVTDVRSHHQWNDIQKIRAADDVRFEAFLDFLVDGIVR